MSGFLSLYNDSTELDNAVSIWSQPDKVDSSTLTNKQWKQLVFLSVVDNVFAVCKFNLQLSNKTLTVMVRNDIAKVGAVPAQILINAFNESIHLLENKIISFAEVSNDDDDDEEEEESRCGDEDENEDDDNTVRETFYHSSADPIFIYLSRQCKVNQGRQIEVAFESGWPQMFVNVISWIKNWFHGTPIGNNQQFEDAFLLILRLVVLPNASNKYHTRHVYQLFKDGLPLRVNAIEEALRDDDSKEEIEFAIEVLKEMGVLDDKEYGIYQIKAKVQFPFAGPQCAKKKCIHFCGDCIDANSEPCTGFKCNECDEMSWYHPACLKYGCMVELPCCHTQICY